MLAIGSKDLGEGIEKWEKHSPPTSELGPVSLPAIGVTCVIIELWFLLLSFKGVFFRLLDFSTATQNT